MSVDEFPEHIEKDFKWRGLALTAPALNDGAPSAPRLSRDGEDEEGEEEEKEEGRGSSAKRKRRRE